jgi:lipoprotein-anchoring transpeptidase ErfK/SrfK
MRMRRCRRKERSVSFRLTGSLPVLLGLASLVLSGPPVHASADWGATGTMPSGQTTAAALQAAVEEIPRRPARLSRLLVSFSSSYPPGTIVVDTASRQLFLVVPDGRALRYPIAVGRLGFTWTGELPVSRKATWPDWRPPDEMRKRDPNLPKFIPGGPKSPLGARAIYLGSTEYRIHGTNAPGTIGRAVSSGCFRMYNEDVVDLSRRTPVGTRVIVLNRLPASVTVGPVQRTVPTATATPPLRPSFRVLPSSGIERQGTGLAVPAPPDVEVVVR